MKRIDWDKTKIRTKLKIVFEDGTKIELTDELVYMEFFPSYESDDRSTYLLSTNERYGSDIYIKFNSDSCDIDVYDDFPNMTTTKMSVKNIDVEHIIHLIETLRHSDIDIKVE